MDGHGRITRFLKDEPVLVASAILALASMAIVPPSRGYLDYIDVETLAVLFCFMAVVAVMAGCNAFDVVSRKMIENERNVRALCLTLVAVPFVSSMFITNDVALITFVPLAITVLELAGLRRLMVPVIVLQTLGANLGCMATPFGSPHNLYLFSRYDVSMWDFLMVLLPLIVVGTAIMLAITWFVGKGETHFDMGDDRRRLDAKRMSAALVLFVLCIATVMGTVPYWASLAIVVLTIIVMMPKALARVDYSLLLTFVFLFVFTGNMAQIDAVGSVLGGMMSWDPVLTSAATSQLISNVPAAVMLSNFTDDWAAMLSGINIGGFGTPIASMASLISLKLYLGTEGHETRRYMAVFTAANVLMLVALLATDRIL